MKNIIKTGITFLFFLFPLQTLSAVSFEILPYIQIINETSAVICFSFPEQTAGVVRYGKSTDYTHSISFSGSAFYKISLVNLVEDTRYYYSISINSGVLTSDNEQYSFITPSGKASSFSFVVIGDTASAPEEDNYPHKRNVESILTYSFPDLILHTGDLVKDNRKECWNLFFSIEHPLLRHTPLFPVAGNNDPSDEEFKNYFPVIDDNLYYAFTYKNCYFIALDIRGDKKTWENGIINESSLQYQFLISALSGKEATEADFIFVYFHTPLYPASGQTQPELINTLTPLFTKYEVNMVFNSGHYYSSTYQDGVWYIVTGGGGAPLSDINHHNEYINSIFTQYHYCRIEVDKRITILSVLSHTGSILDTLTAYSKNDKSSISDTSGTDSIIRIFFSPDCPVCKELKQNILPAVLNSTTKKYSVEYYNVKEKENMELLLKTEAKLNDSGNSIPAIVIGDTIISGSDDIEARLRMEISGEKSHTQTFQKPRIVHLILLIFFIALIFTVILLFMKMRKPGN